VVDQFLSAAAFSDAVGEVEHLLAILRYLEI
jgi:hypothetical protein